MSALKVNISCLPVAGPENPYQLLMMDGLRKDNRLQVQHGDSGKFCGLLVTALRQRPDYIHIDWLQRYYLRRTVWMTWVLFPLFVLQVWIVRYLLRVRLVWTLHNIQPHDQSFSGPYRWARQVFAANCTWIRVFSASTIATASEVLGVPVSRFRVQPEGSYIGWYPDTVTRSDARAQLGLGMNEFVLLFLGGIKPYKGVERLITAFQRLARPHWRLLIAGACSYPDYQQLLSDATSKVPGITFHPEQVPVEEVQYWMRAADLVVLPFLRIENSGSAILAMGFSKAVAAPAAGVLPDRLSAQEALLFRQDPEEILSNVALLMPEYLEKAGQANYKQLQKHRWEDFAVLFT